MVNSVIKAKGGSTVSPVFAGFPGATVARTLP
jgi:hypothetical protein